MRKKYVFLPVLCLLFYMCASGQKESSTGLKDVLKDKFLIGTALNEKQFEGEDVHGERLIIEHFNSVVAENCMKSEKIHPEENKFFFDDADQFVAFGERNGMFIVGHTLIWHSQTPDWFFVDAQGNDVSRDVLIERMKIHITTLVTRYKGRVKGWDVVNEAINDDGSWRQSKFYTIIGEDYVRLAFEFARKADPQAELYYNDYSMAMEGRREGTIRMVKALQQQGIRIDGIGMQGHLGMDYPAVADFEKSIVAFSKLGLNVMITEMDLSVLPSPKPNVGADVRESYAYRQEMNPFVTELPEDVKLAWEKRYSDFFNLFLKHQDKISRVTLWGVTDADSWKNDWPITGRTDYPLLFDREYQPKPIVQQIISSARQNNNLTAENK